MAGGYPVGLQWSNLQSIGVSAASSLGTSVPGSASTNTKGSWTQLIASTTIDIAWLYCIINGNTTTAVNTAVDIGVGASGSETAVISNLMMDYNGLLYETMIFPCNIPAGSRVSARIQSAAANDHVIFSIIGIADAFSSAGGNSISDTYGFVSGSTIGTSIDPGATANTKGSYTQITSATTADLAGFFCFFDVLAQASQAVDVSFLFDIAVGAAGSERIILPDFPAFKRSSGNVFFTPFYSPYFAIPIPAGSRIAVRAQASSATATSRLGGIVIYGVRQ